MHFLITNDDGFDAPGILALEQAAGRLGEFTVVAPDEHQSGCSHQTTGEPLILKEVQPSRYQLNGMPADCARIGLTQLGLADCVVLSGVNAGGNLGVDVCMSGTVAAAREAALLGAHAVALSCYRPKDADFDWPAIADWTEFLLQNFVERKLPPGWLWNINMPTPLPAISADHVVECELNPHPLLMDYHVLPEGGYHYRGDYHGRAHNEQTDVAVCMRQRKVAVTCMPALPVSGPKALPGY